MIYMFTRYDICIYIILCFNICMFSMSSSTYSYSQNVCFMEAQSLCRFLSISLSLSLCLSLLIHFIDLYTFFSTSIPMDFIIIICMYTLVYIHTTHSTCSFWMLNWWFIYVAGLLFSPFSRRTTSVAVGTVTGFFLVGSSHRSLRLFLPPVFVLF